MRTPANALARELVPLSALERTDPSAYAEAIVKYDGDPERRNLRNTRIPRTSATWADVVFLSPILPHAILQAWRAIGRIQLPAQEFWAIPVEALPDAVVFDRTLSRTGDPIDLGEVTPLDPRAYRALEQTTPRNRAWIARLTQRGERGAWFNGTPQILVPGPVPLRHAQLVDWADALPLDQPPAQFRP